MAKPWRGNGRPYGLYQYAEVTADNEVGAYNKDVTRKRKERAEEAGKASGKARRARAKGRRVAHRRDRPEALCIAFKIQQVNRKTFWALDHKRRQELGIGPSERGTLTLWAEYTSCMRNYRAKGQAFLTTNGQRARALEQHGRPRCTRTVQRAHRELHRMGLLTRHHVRRSGRHCIPGKLDCLSVYMQSKFCHPAVGSPKGGSLSPPTLGASPASPANVSARDDASNPRGSPPASEVASPETDQQEVAPDGREDEAVKRPQTAATRRKNPTDEVDRATISEDREPVDWVAQFEEEAAREDVSAVLQRMCERQMHQKRE